MSELFDKEVNACTKREFEKNFWVYASSRMPTKKCAMKMKQRNKEKQDDVRVKMCFWWKEALYKAHTKNWGKRSKQASSKQFWTQ